MKVVVYVGETGMKSLYCVYDCCHIDFASECTSRGDYFDMYPVHMTFAQAFDQPPVVMVSASSNFFTLGKFIYCIRY